uniref:BTB domain-containing protein n=2 Tax=Mesocestoides corti TaxID=53468 RepID=A0A5K3EYG5_MESCO
MPFNRFEKLRHCKSLLDFKIVSKDGRNVLASRFLLATRFPLIADAVTADERGCMEWRRFSADVVEDAITFAYTGRVEITMSNVACLFLLSTNLGCSTLTSGCIEFLGPRLSKDNVEVFWSIANATMNGELMSICVPVISGDFYGFTGLPMFPSSTDPEYLVALVKDIRLTGVSECSKLRAITTWFEAANPEDNANAFKDLVGAVELGRISSHNFVDICTSKCVMNLPVESKNYLVNAWKLATKSNVPRKIASSMKPAAG